MYGLGEHRRGNPGKPGNAFANRKRRGLKQLLVLRGLLEGLTNAQIAAAMGLSEKTVRNHITGIFDRLAVDNRGQAIVLAREAGIESG
mgnify:CR=1 FL=1